MIATKHGGKGSFYSQILLANMLMGQHNNLAGSWRAQIAVMIQFRLFSSCTTMIWCNIGLKPVFGGRLVKTTVAIEVHCSIYERFSSHEIIFFAACSPHGTIRLVGGTSSLEGRVEVCVNGLWGTVCSDGWTARDANVACKQLGYSGSGKNDLQNSVNLRTLFLQCIITFYFSSWLITDATAFTSANFGQGYYPILLDDVACTVYESRLVDCPYDSNTADCTHSRDAGVRCVSRELHSYMCAYIIFAYNGAV